MSVAELIRHRCENKPVNSEDEEMLLAMAKEVRKATARAKESLEKGLADAEKVLKEIRLTKTILNNNLTGNGHKGYYVRNVYFGC